MSETPTQQGISLPPAENSSQTFSEVTEVLDVAPVPCGAGSNVFPNF